LRVHEKKGVGGKRHFAEVAEEISDDGFFGIGWEVAFLIDVDGGIVAERISSCGELHVCRPERAVVYDLDGSTVRNASAELEIEPIADSEVPEEERGKKRAAFEADTSGSVGLAIDDHLEARSVGRSEVSLLIDPIPVIDMGGIGLFGIHEGKFEQVGGKDAEAMVSVRGDSQVGITRIDCACILKKGQTNEAKRQT